MGGPLPWAAVFPECFSMPATQFTTTNRGWLMKMMIFLVVLIGFGLYGLYDATLAYPGRGMEDASYKKKLYLERADEASKVGRSDLLDNAGIAAPEARRATLVARRAELEASEEKGSKLQAARAAGGAEGTRAERDYRDLLPTIVEAAALRWLDSLNLVSGLKPAMTEMKDPRAELKALTERWSKASPPKALNFYDIPMQWCFTVVGFGGGLYLLYVIFRTSRKRYGWDPAQQRLYFPDGKTLVPGDISEFDKRKWDKFFIFLHRKPEAGGGEVKLDLLRHAPLEKWVLEMEKTAFPQNTATPSPAATEAATAAAAAAQ